MVRKLLKKILQKRVTVGRSKTSVNDDEGAIIITSNGDGEDDDAAAEIGFGSSTYYLVAHLEPHQERGSGDEKLSTKHEQEDFHDGDDDSKKCNTDSDCPQRSVEKLYFVEEGCTRAADHREQQSQQSQQPQQPQQPQQGVSKQKTQSDGDDDDHAACNATRTTGPTSRSIHHTIAQVSSDEYAYHEQNHVIIESLLQKPEFHCYDEEHDIGNEVQHPSPNVPSSYNGSAYEQQHHHESEKNSLSNAMLIKLMKQKVDDYKFKRFLITSSLSSFQEPSLSVNIMNAQIQGTIAHINSLSQHCQTSIQLLDYWHNSDEKRNDDLPPLLQQQQNPMSIQQQFFPGISSIFLCFDHRNYVLNQPVYCQASAKIIKQQQASPSPSSTIEESNIHHDHATIENTLIQQGEQDELVDILCSYGIECGIKVSNTSSSGVLAMMKFEQPKEEETSISSTTATATTTTTTTSSINNEIHDNNDTPPTLQKAIIMTKLSAIAMRKKLESYRDKNNTNNHNSNTKKDPIEIPFIIFSHKTNYKTATLYSTLIEEDSDTPIVYQVYTAMNTLDEYQMKYLLLSLVVILGRNFQMMNRNDTGMNMLNYDDNEDHEIIEPEQQWILDLDNMTVDYQRPKP